MFFSKQVVVYIKSLPAFVVLVSFELADEWYDDVVVMMLLLLSKESFSSRSAIFILYVSQSKHGLVEEACSMLNM